MEKEYKSIQGQNYIVLPVEETGVNIDTQINILTHSEIDFLLPMSSTAKNGLHYLQYNITSLLPLQSIVERNKLSTAQFFALIGGYLSATKECDDYALPMGSLSLTMDDVYINISNFSPRYLFYPVATSRNPLAVLSQWIRDMISGGYVLIDGNTNVILDAINRPETSLDDLTALVAEKRTGVPAAPAVRAAQPAAPEQSHPMATPQPEFSQPVIPSVAPQRVSSPPKAVPATTPKKEKSANSLSEKYPKKNLILAVALVVASLLLLVLAFVSGMAVDPATGNLDVTKLLGVIILVLALDAILLRKLLGEESRQEPKESNGKKEKPSKEKKQPQVLKTPDFSSTPEDFSNLLGSPQNIPSAPEPVTPEPVFVPSIPPTPVAALVSSQPQAVSHNAIEYSDEHTVLIGSESAVEGELALRLQDGTIIPITKSPFRVGRDQALVDYVFKQPTIGRFHAEFSKGENGWSIVDNNSSNHTYVNGVMLSPYAAQPIKNGDNLQLADLEAYILES